jgi:hypothetical protein
MSDSRLVHRTTTPTTPKAHDPEALSRLVAARVDFDATAAIRRPQVAKHQPRVTCSDDELMAAHTQAEPFRF